MRVSARALSVSCPHCRRVVSLTDLRIVGSHPGKTLATCGDIRIEATARLQVEVIARKITVLGRVRGPVTASESVEVGSTGYVMGDIRAPKIVVQEGGVIQGNCTMTCTKSRGDSEAVTGGDPVADQAAVEAGPKTKQQPQAKPLKPAGSTPAPGTAKPRPLARPQASLGSRRPGGDQ